VCVCVCVCVCVRELLQVKASRREAAATFDTIIESLQKHKTLFKLQIEEATRRDQQKRSKAIQDLEPTMQTVRKLEALFEAVEHVPVRETHLDVLLSSTRIEQRESMQLAHSTFHCPTQRIPPHEPFDIPCLSTLNVKWEGGASASRVIPEVIVVLEKVQAP